MNHVIDIGFPSSIYCIYEYVVATFLINTQREAQIIFLHIKCIILQSQLYLPDLVQRGLFYKHLFFI